MFLLLVKSGTLSLSFFVNFSSQRYKSLNFLQSYGIPCPPTHFIYGNLQQLRWSTSKVLSSSFLIYPSFQTSLFCVFWGHLWGAAAMARQIRQSCWVSRSCYLGSFSRSLCNREHSIRYYMGLKPRIIVAELDVVKHILVKDINTFTNRPVRCSLLCWINPEMHHFYLPGCPEECAHSAVAAGSEVERDSPDPDSNVQFYEAETGRE